MTDSPSPRVVPVDPDIIDLIPGYIENRKKDIHDLREAAVARDFVAVRNIAHQLRGSGGGYGLEAVSDIGMRMGEAARAADLASINVWIDELERYIAQVKVVPRESD